MKRSGLPSSSTKGRREARRARGSYRDTARYISAQQILANRRNMDSRSIDWHAVRFIPEIGNLQGIDETLACCGAVAQGVRILQALEARRRHVDIAQEVRPFRHLAAVDFPPRDHAPTHDARTTFATSRRRVASTGKHPITRPRLRIRRRRWAAHFFFAIPCARCVRCRERNLSNK